MSPGQTLKWVGVAFVAGLALLILAGIASDVWGAW